MTRAARLWWRCCCGWIGQIQRLLAGRACRLRQDERIAELERRLNRSSRNSSPPPSADPPQRAGAREGSFGA